MRVCVDDGRLAMGRPAGMADAAAAGHGAAAVGHLAQDLQAALGLDDLDLAGGVLHRHTGRVIAAVFQLGPAVQQNGGGLCRAGKAYDSTHNRYPPFVTALKLYFPFYWIRAKYFYSICHLGTNVYSFTQILYRCAQHKDKAGSRQGLRLPAARILPFRFLTPYKNESKVIAHLLA